MTDSTTPGVIRCAHCDVRPAQSWLEPDAPYDPACHTCLAEFFECCPNCNRWVLRDQIVSVETAPATWGQPAEYSTGCDKCFPQGEEREHLDDDGQDYADPRDFMEGRE